MADKKISQLTTLAQADVAVTADFLPIVDTSATETKKATPQSVVLGALGATSANVGIGTTSPAGRVDSVSNATAAYAARASTTGANQTVNAVNAYNSDASLFALAKYNAVQHIWGYAGTTEGMRLDASGNVGIGTASPSYRLHVERASAGVTGYFFNADGTNNPRLVIYGDSSGTWLQHTFSTGANSLIFGVGGTIGSAVERMRITNDGNIVAGSSAALATNATNGFLYVPTCAGTPTGVPTAFTGMAPIVVNTTNNKLYFYSGGAWRDAGP